jgi:hypothetical protein
MTRLRLMLLSVGSLVAQNVIDALGSRRERFVLIGTNSVAEAAGNFRCDIAHLVPSAASGAAYIERLRELIHLEQPDLVIPTRDDDVLALALVGEQSRRSNTVLVTGSVAAARLWNDKVETARFACRHRLPFAPTVETAHEALELAAAHGLPLIGKPRYGNATRGVVLLRTNAEIERAFGSAADLIAQPFLDPPSNMDALVAPFEAGLPFCFSFPEAGQHIAQLMVGPDGAVSNPFTTRGTVVGGQGIHFQRYDNSELLEVGRRYGRAAAAEGWKGPLNVQLKCTPQGAFVAFELNGRFSGGTAARMCLGYDEVGEVVHRFLPAAAFPLISDSESDFVQNYLRSYPVPREGVAALRTSGSWSRPVV